MASPFSCVLSSNTHNDVILGKVLLMILTSELQELGFAGIWHLPESHSCCLALTGCKFTISSLQPGLAASTYSVLPWKCRKFVRHLFLSNKVCFSCFIITCLPSLLNSVFNSCLPFFSSRRIIFLFMGMDYKS